MDNRSINETLCANGFLFLPRLAPHETTTTVASHLGELIDLHSMLHHSPIPTVQSIRPRHKYDSPSNIYSGTFGTQEFPLHTDLAHWLVPPRYLILRCLRGEPDVVTDLLDIFSFINFLGRDVAEGAMMRPRRVRADSPTGPLSVVFNRSSTLGVRWDRLFLSPMNLRGREALEKMTATCQIALHRKTVVLQDCGDTLLIDNWRCLHGRSSVSESSMGRRVERVFLSRIF